MNNLPEAINIQGTFWDLEVAPPPQGKLPLDHAGSCDDKSLTITVHCTGQLTEDVDTLLHEIFEAGASQGLSFGTTDDAEKELRIRQHARFLAQVLVENRLLNPAVISKDTKEEDGA